MIDQTPRSFFEKSPIRAVALPQWMDWSSGKEGAEYAIVLPMIQRGAVWAPHKLMDLWDTLLRDMPIGAFMVSEQTGESKQKVIPAGQAATRETKANDLGLIDGQQRTLAMMVGWTGLMHVLRPVALWVDLGQKPQGEYRFRLIATTRSQPFGYERASAGGQVVSKLARHKLRQANHLWRQKDQSTPIDPEVLWQTEGFMPWESTLAVPLPKVMACREEAALLALVASHKKAKVDWLVAKLAELDKPSVDERGQELNFLNALREQLVRRLKDIEAVTEDHVYRQVRALMAARHKVATSQFPVIQVREAHFANIETADGDNGDPPLAILFKRVGSAGVSLSDADYVYAVIKHMEPDVHDMVEGLLKDPRIQAIYTATSLVMTAVRMTVLQMRQANQDGGNANAGLNDMAKLDKAAFARLVRNHPEFVKTFKKHIEKEGAFQTGLSGVLDALAYEPETFAVGLPKHALSLVQIPLLETLLAWVTLNNPASTRTNECRLPMVRFVLQGYLCVLHAARASEVMIKAIEAEASRLADNVFPDQALLKLLLPTDASSSPLAHALPSPQTLQTIAQLTTRVGATGLPVQRIEHLTTSHGATGLRGWQRFVVKPDIQVPNAAQHAQLYKRWWNQSGHHAHPMLLWLQRDYVFKKFEALPAMAGMEDETPFDYDHLVPSAHWANWSGAGQNSGALTEFEQDGKGSYGYTGNSIGNLHVFDSSENRSRGDKPLECMLTDVDFVKNSLLSIDEKWTQASPNNENHRKWTTQRALAFQSAVEDRAFALYEKFCADLQCTECEPSLVAASLNNESQSSTP